MKLLIWIVCATSLLSIFSTFSSAGDATLVEVGFTQDGEPEPHMLIVADQSDVKVYQLTEAKNRTEDLKKAKGPVAVPTDASGKKMSSEVFQKRLTQGLETYHFFTGGQPGRKRGCKDEYVVRILHAGKFRERRGCSNQNNDQYAAFAQNAFREAFGAWNK